MISISLGVEEEPALAAQLDTAYQRGVSIFCATGNDGFIHYPARSPSVMAVGATDNSDVVWNYSGQGWQLDIVAPSGDTLSSNIWTWDIMGPKGYVTYVYSAATCGNSDNYNCKFNGTSAATPIVAGVAALILSLRPDFMDSTDPAGIIRRVLEGSAEDKGPVGWDEEYGWGRVNAYHALQSVCNCPHQGDLAPYPAGNNVIDVNDVLYLIKVAFTDATDTKDLPCPKTRSDVNNSGFVDVNDVLYLIRTAFSNGAPPVNPCVP